MVPPSPRRPRTRRAVSALAVFALFGLTGCLTFETLITVRHDGSGTVETAFALSGPMLDMITSLTGETNLCEEEDLRKEAASMGEGVRLLSAEPLEEGGKRGCRAVYAFDDVNTLRINQNPGRQMPDEMTAGQPAPPEEVVAFRFTPGRTATLEIQMPRPVRDTPEADATADADTTGRAMQQAMLREMLQDARIHMAVAVDGAITETNASYREGSRLTLVEMDFNELLEDEEQLERLADANPKTPAEVKALLEGVSGIKVETNETIQVRFR